MTGTGLALSGTDAGNYTVNASAAATANITPIALTITANNAAKTYGSTLNFAGTEFSSTGLIAGETIGTVNLASTGAASGAIVAGPYAITASGGAGGSFLLSNYTPTYVNGSLTLNRAPLTVTANAASKLADGLAYRGGNGVSFNGLVNGETSATVVNGTLIYGGSSQGAIDAGGYVITPGGLTLASNNYTMSYANGTLTILPSTGQLPGAQSAINTAQQGGGGGSGGGSGFNLDGDGGGMFGGSDSDGPEMGLPDGVE